MRVVYSWYHAPVETCQNQTRSEAMAPEAQTSAAKPGSPSEENRKTGRGFVVAGFMAYQTYHADTVTYRFVRGSVVSDSIAQASKVNLCGQSVARNCS